MLFYVALIVASRNGHVDTVKYLLEQPSIQYNLKDETGRTAVMVSATTEIEDLFLSGYGTVGKNNDLDVTGFKKYELIQAGAHGNVEKVKKLLSGPGTHTHTFYEFFGFNLIYKYH